VIDASGAWVRSLGATFSVNHRRASVFVLKPAWWPRLPFSGQRML
jgi:hypothetical protein